MYALKAHVSSPFGWYRLHPYFLKSSPKLFSSHLWIVLIAVASRGGCLIRKGSTVDLAFTDCLAAIWLANWHYFTVLRFSFFFLRHTWDERHALSCSYNEQKDLRMTALLVSLLLPVLCHWFLERFPKPLPSDLSSFTRAKPEMWREFEKSASQKGSSSVFSFRATPFNPSLV